MSGQARPQEQQLRQVAGALADLMESPDRDVHRPAVRRAALRLVAMLGRFASDRPEGGTESGPDQEPADSTLRRSGA